MKPRTPSLFLLLLLAGLVIACGDDGMVDPVSLAPAETLAPLQAPPDGVRITEIHYDNTSTDSGEAVEITGPAGTDLTGWSLVLYNGSSSQLKPYDTVALDATLPATCEGEGVIVLNFPTNGIQNGSPDGLALVDGSGTVVEFLSYEGTFTAAEGPAAGMTSTDIGVQETSSTAVGESLQRYGDTWSGPAASSFGECNGDGGDPGDGEPGDGPTDVFLSELHYDNDGGDENEAFEVSAPAGTDLAGWSVVLYNGNGGAPYGSVDLAGVIPSDCRPEGGLAFPYSGIQNGPDGLALVDPSGAVVEFLSYEGTFTAVGGPADGVTSTDMGVEETSSTEATESLQRAAVDQPWTGPAASTFGCESDDGSGGSGGTPSGPLYLSEIRADQPGGDSDEYLEIGGAPGTTMGGVSLVILGDPPGGGAGVVEEVVDLSAHALTGSGAFVMAESSFSLGTADLTTSLNFENGDNPTYLLVTGFTGADGQDLDTNDDGTLDSTPWTQVLDCLSLIEYLGLQPIYCDARLGREESFTPGHSVRTDAGWISANFTPGSGDTPGTLAFDPATAVAGQIAPWGVSAPGVPTTVSVSASYVELPVGYNRALYVNVYDDYRDEVPGATVEFTSTDPSVVTADAFGNLSAEGVGTATLEVSAVGSELAAEVTVVVIPDVPSGVAFQDHTEFGIPEDGSPHDDLILTRDEYTLSYNPELAGANWVSWNLDASHIGDADRCECYTPDPALPATAPAVVNFDFTGSGYSRGHMVQSFNRTATLPDNAATYLTTNILPQAGANNGGPWGDFEYYTNGRAFDGEEVYLVAGGVFGESPATLKNEGKVAIPDWTWKVAVFLDRDETLEDVTSLDDLEVIAILTPNRIESGVPGTVDGIQDDWTAYQVEVDEIEALTGYDLLDLLPDGLEGRLESGFDGLEAAFDAALEEGAMHRAAEVALGAQLRLAARHLERGRTFLAAVRVRQFLHLLDVFERIGKVSADTAAPLRAEAEKVLDVLRP